MRWGLHWRPVDTRGVQVRLLHGREVADLKSALKAKKAEMLQTMTGIPDHSFKARAPCGPICRVGERPPHEHLHDVRRVQY